MNRLQSIIERKDTFTLLNAASGGPCYFKNSSYPPAAHILRAIGSSYSSQRNHRSSLLERQALRAGLSFHAEFYFNGHNAIQLQIDRQGIQYRIKDNAFVDVNDPEALQKAAQSLNGRAVLNRISYWIDMFFRFDDPVKGRTDG